jgi:hypothetical protein
MMVVVVAASLLALGMQYNIIQNIFTAGTKRRDPIKHVANPLASFLVFHTIQK